VVARYVMELFIETQTHAWIQGMKWSYQMLETHADQIKVIIYYKSFSQFSIVIIAGL
jgi:hypothetical protein